MSTDSTEHLTFAIVLGLLQLGQRFGDWKNEWIGRGFGVLSAVVAVTWCYSMMPFAYATGLAVSTLLGVVIYGARWFEKPSLLGTQTLVPTVTDLPQPEPAASVINSLVNCPDLAMKIVETHAASSSIRVTNEGPTPAKHVTLEAFVRDGRKLQCVPTKTDSIAPGATFEFDRAVMCLPKDSGWDFRSIEMYLMMYSLEPNLRLRVLFQDRLDAQFVRSFMLDRSKGDGHVECYPEPLLRRKRQSPSGAQLFLKFPLGIDAPEMSECHDFMVLLNAGHIPAKRVLVAPVILDDCTIEFEEIDVILPQDKATLYYEVRQHGQYRGGNRDRYGPVNAWKSVLENNQESVGLSILVLDIAFIDTDGFETWTKVRVEYNSLGHQISAKEVAY